VGQRTFETKSFYLILAEKLFTLPAANEMLPLSALFAGKSQEVGMSSVTPRSLPRNAFRSNVPRLAQLSSINASACSRQSTNWI
jgi:hypothetical protein